MTASSSSSWSRFSPPLNSVNGHVSTMLFMVCRWPQLQEGDWVRPHLCKLARHGPWPVRRLCMTTKIKVEVDTFTGLRDTYYVHICNTCVCVILWSWCMNAAMDADVGSRLIPHWVGVHCWTARRTVVSVLWGVQTACERCQTAACQCWGMVTHTHRKSLILSLALVLGCP